MKGVFTVINIEEQQWKRALELEEELTDISNFNEKISFVGSVALRDKDGVANQVAFSGSKEDILMNYREITANLFRLIVEQNLDIDTDAIVEAHREGMAKGFINLFIAKGGQQHEKN